MCAYLVYCMYALAWCCCLSNTLPSSWFSFLSEQTADKMDRVGWRRDRWGICYTGIKTTNPNGLGEGLVFCFDLRWRGFEVNILRKSGHTEIKGLLRKSLKRERMRKKGKCGKRKQMPALLYHMVYVCVCDRHRLCVVALMCKCVFMSSGILCVCATVEACCCTLYY